MNIFVIHGLGAGEHDNWFPWIKEIFEPRGFKVFIPTFPNTLSPNLNEWLNNFNQYLSIINENTILIGHSLGCSFILNFLEKNNIKVKTTILVAPFISNLDNSYME